MTEFASRPPGLDTVEKELAWALICLDNFWGSGKKKYQEIDNAPMEDVVDYSIITAADGTKRMLFRGSIELDPAYAVTGTGKLWAFARVFGTANIPAAYQVD